MAKLRYSEFKHRIDVDAFERAVGFEPLGDDGRGNDVGHCLFPQNHQHGDSTGKFAIHRDKLVYNCWVCGGGSLLSLAMELFDMDVDDATYWIYQFTQGTDDRTDIEFRDYLLEMLEDVEERDETMPYFNERVLERYTDSPGYFRSRGISDAVIDEYGLRYGNMTMRSAPVKNGEKIDDDYFGPCAIFPHYWQGKLVGWQQRWIDFDEEHIKTPKWLAKYTNTTDFPKHNTLFNYDKALKAREPVVVLESMPAVLFLASHNVPAVSYFGGDIKDAQLRLLRRFTQGVVLAPDNDKTGDRFVNRALQYLERFIPVYIAEKTTSLGAKSDLGDYAKTSQPYQRLMHHLVNKTHLSGVKL